MLHCCSVDAGLLRSGYHSVTTGLQTPRRIRVCAKSGISITRSTCSPRRHSPGLAAGLEFLRFWCIELGEQLAFLERRSIMRERSISCSAPRRRRSSPPIEARGPELPIFIARQYAWSPFEVKSPSASSHAGQAALPLSPREEALVCSAPNKVCRVQTIAENDVAFGAPRPELQDFAPGDYFLIPTTS